MSNKDNISIAVGMMGARMHYAVPRILSKAGLLKTFYTDITSNSLLKLLAHLPFVPQGLKRLAARSPQGISCTKTFNSFGIEYWRARQRAQSSEDMMGVHLWAGTRFCELINADIKWDDITAVYTYNTAGLELLAAAKRNKKLAVMEQTIAAKAIEVDLLQKEAEVWPGWTADDPAGKVTEAFIEREQAEWDIADLIICASEFVKESIAKCGGPVEKCRIVPYGVQLNPAEKERSLQSDRPLRVLTAGTLGLRKGTPYIVDAAKRLQGKVSFRIVGGYSNLTQVVIDTIRKDIELEGSVPRSEMPNHYEWADVFLLPSLCEGSATVIYEALAAGVPVVCTPNSGSIVEDGVNGFIIPVADGDAIIHSLLKFSRDHGLLNKMSKGALSSSKNFTLEDYGKRLINIFTGIS